MHAVQHLHLFEQMQELDGIDGRVAVMIKLSDKLVLAGQMTLSQPDVPGRHGDVIRKCHRAERALILLVPLVRRGLFERIPENRLLALFGDANP
jgi:hypothetical protein